MSDGKITCGACGATNPPNGVVCVACGALLAAYRTPTGADQAFDPPVAADGTPVSPPPPIEPLPVISPTLPVMPRLVVTPSPAIAQSPPDPVVPVTVERPKPEPEPLVLPEPEPPGDSERFTTMESDDPTEATPDPDVLFTQVIRESGLERVPVLGRPRRIQIRGQFLPRELGGSRLTITGSRTGSPPQMIAAGVAVLLGSCVAFVLGGTVDGAGCFSGLGGIGLVAAFVLIGLGASGGLKKEE